MLVLKFFYQKIKYIQLVQMDQIAVSVVLMVLVVSEELDELLELSDRLHVMAEGRLSPALTREEANVSRIGAWMSGLWDAPAAAQEVNHAAS